MSGDKCQAILTFVLLSLGLLHSLGNKIDQMRTVLRHRGQKHAMCV
jgi:hypothetical protein